LRRARIPEVASIRLGTKPRSTAHIRWILFASRPAAGLYSKGWSELLKFNSWNFIRLSWPENCERSARCGEQGEIL